MSLASLTVVRWPKSLPGVLAVLAAAWLAGCAALGVSTASLGGSIVGASVGAAAKTGTEHELTGAVARTYPVALPDVRQAAVDTLERLDIAPAEESGSDPGAALVGHANERTVRIGFERVTDVMTRVRVVVSRSWLRKDPATAEEILTQLESTLDSRYQAGLRPASPRAAPGWR